MPTPTPGTCDIYCGHPLPQGGARTTYTPTAQLRRLAFGSEARPHWARPQATASVRPRYVPLSRNAK